MLGCFSGAKSSRQLATFEPWYAWLYAKFLCTIMLSILSPYTKNIHYLGLNHVSQERLDPLIHHFLSLLGLAESQLAYVGAELLLLASGVSVLFAVRRSSAGILVGLWLTIAMVSVMGLEPFYLKIHWLPWLIAAYTLHLLSGSLATTVLVTLVTALWVVSSGTLACTGIVIAAVASILTAMKRRAFVVTVERPELSYRGLLILVGLGLVAAVYTMPEYPMPKYPANARLTLSDAFATIPFPLLGTRLHPVPIVESVYYGLLALYTQHYLLLLISVGLGVGFAAVVWDEKVKYVLQVLALHFLLSVVIVGSVLFWPIENIAQHPFYLLARVVPGIGLAFLPWLILPFFLLLLATSAFADLSRRAMTGVLILSGVMAASLSVSGNYPPFQAHFSEFAVKEEQLPYGGLTWSPSTHVVALVGTWSARPGIERERDFASLKRLVARREYTIAKVEAYPEEQNAGRAVDGNVFTSWSTHRAQQAGDHFTVHFTEPIELIRAILSIQETPKLFPCSLSVWAVDALGVEQQLYYQDPWPGPVQWTVDGFPYFSEKRNVIVDFPTSFTVQSLRFEIASTTCGGQPWAVGELKLYGLP